MPDLTMPPSTHPWSDHICEAPDVPGPPTHRSRSSHTLVLQLGPQGCPVLDSSDLYPKTAVPADDVIASATSNAEPSPVMAPNVLEYIEKDEHQRVPDIQRYLQSVTFTRQTITCGIMRSAGTTTRHENDTDGGARRIYYATNFSTVPEPRSRLDIVKYFVNGSSKLEFNSSPPSSDDVTSGAISLGLTFRNYPMTPFGSIPAVFGLIAQCQEKREKICIFGSSPLTLYLVTFACELLGIKVGTIRAGQTPAQRGDVIRAFDDPKDTTFSVLVCSSRSASESITLQHGCRVAAFVDVEAFNTYLQGAGRFHRFGAKGVQYVYILTVDLSHDQPQLGRQAIRHGLQLAAHHGLADEANAANFEDFYAEDSYSHKLKDEVAIQQKVFGFHAPRNNKLSPSCRNMSKKSLSHVPSVTDTGDQAMKAELKDVAEWTFGSVNFEVCWGVNVSSKSWTKRFEGHVEPGWHLRGK